MKTHEEWRPFREGTYGISSLGRVRRDLPGRGTRAGRLVCQQVTGSGYPMAALSVGGKRTPRNVHSMVAEVFLGVKPHGAEINHKDGDKTNNCLSNLEYASRSENAFHRYHVLQEGKGVAMKDRVRLPVIEMIARLVSGASYRTVGEEYGCSATTVQRIWQGKHWQIRQL